MLKAVSECAKSGEGVGRKICKGFPVPEILTNAVLAYTINCAQASVPAVLNCKYYCIVRRHYGLLLSIVNLRKLINTLIAITTGACRWEIEASGEQSSGTCAR
jgi:hypothetical protein